MLADYYFSDPRLTLVPIEHLSPAGLSAEYASLVVRERSWTTAHVALFDAGFSAYWQRSEALAGRSRWWAPPRLRHVAIVHDPFAVHPYAQLLNTSAWTLYASDLDPTTSNPEFVAYLLVHGDRMAQSGEVTRAALDNAGYWFERTAAECRAFAEAVQVSTRPDADAFRLLARATVWLRQLWHETLRPPTGGAEPMRTIPGTGLLVPRVVEAQPPALVEGWTKIAEAGVATYQQRWRHPDTHALAALCETLRTQQPRLLVTAGDRILWDPDHPQRLGPLRTMLKGASGAAVADVHADLAIVDARTRAFHAALVDAGALAQPDPAMEQGGYAFVHPTRRRITYNLKERGIDRLTGPALPFARVMLGARTIHEWAHLAVDSGWVGPTSPALLETRTALLVEQLGRLPVQRPDHPGGTELARLLFARMPDFQANVLAQRFLTLAERETYVRHNIRTLRGIYPAAEWWRALIRYLLEFQYLRFSAVRDRRTFFLRSTWFDADFLTTGRIDDATFDALAGAVSAVCDVYAVDESRFRADGLVTDKHR